MSVPVLSIGLPVRNGERLLRGAVESLLAQDFQDFELIISDNASTDATEDICNEFARADRRINYIRNKKNIGAIPNHNRLVEMSRGKYFKWAAHDDECHPGMIGACVRQLERDSEDLLLVFTRAELINSDGEIVDQYFSPIESADARPHRRLSAVVANVCLGTPLYGVFRREALLKTSLLGAFFSSDHVLLAEIAMLGRMMELPDYLFRKRVHPERSTALHNGWKEWAAWSDPSRRPNYFSRFRADWVVFEYVRSAFRMPIRPSDRIRCALTAIKNSPTERARCERWRKRFARLIGR